MFEIYKNNVLSMKFTKKVFPIYNEGGITTGTKSMQFTQDIAW